MPFTLTHWGRVTHICVGYLTIIGSDNGLSPGRHQAITWTNVGIWLIGPLWTNFSEMLIEIHIFSFKKIHLKMSSGKWRPFCFGLNVLTCFYTFPARLFRKRNHLTIENIHDGHITVMSHRRHDVSTHQPLDWWVKRLFVLTTKQANAAKLAFCDGNPSLAGGWLGHRWIFLTKGQKRRKSVCAKVPTWPYNQAQMMKHISISPMNVMSSLGWILCHLLNTTFHGKSRHKS